MIDQRAEFTAEYDKAELERRRERVRSAWNYEKVDHIPIALSLDYNPFGYTMHDILYDHDKQFELRMYSCEQSLKLLPDDYIPCAFVDVGCVGISNAFGAKIYKGENEQQTPGIRGRVFDSISDTYDLTIPDMRNTGFSKYYLERLKYFYEKTEGCVYLSGMDNNGAMSVAMDLIGSEELFISMIEEPEAVTHLLEIINGAIIEETNAAIEIVGDINNMTSTDFFFRWCPEGKKGHTSADLCTAYSPEMFRQFDIPANRRIYDLYGAGLMHNCGPNPCIEEYCSQHKNFAGVDLAYRYSSTDLQNIRKYLRGKIVYFSYDFPDKAIEQYRETMEALAPDVIAIPLIMLTDENVDVEEYYGELLKIASEYANRVFG